ncbi:hypothetical protein GGI11_003755 [Coemansia sp. RSA 2049]|nr:hypothetical protein GGI11_003755 [Coemansia sp. RSA 2049]
MSSADTVSHTFELTTKAEASTVELLGTFGSDETSHWTPIAMAKAPTSSGDDEESAKYKYSVTLDTLKSGSEYLYKFKVDGEWELDPKADTTTDDAGLVNNVLKTAAAVSSTAATDAISKVESVADAPQPAAAAAGDDAAPTSSTDAGAADNTATADASAAAEVSAQQTEETTSAPEEVPSGSHDSSQGAQEADSQSAGKDADQKATKASRPSTTAESSEHKKKHRGLFGFIKRLFV